MLDYTDHPQDVRLALEETARWFEHHPNRWLRSGTYTTGKGVRTCYCLVGRFDVHIRQLVQSDEPTFSAHSYLAQLVMDACEREAVPEQYEEWGNDVRFGRVSTINDFRLGEVHELASFLRWMKELV